MPDPSENERDAPAPPWAVSMVRETAAVDALVDAMSNPISLPNGGYFDPDPGRDMAQRVLMALNFRHGWDLHRLPLKVSGATGVDDATTEDPTQQPPTGTIPD